LFIECVDCVGYRVATGRALYELDYM